jgi:tRNA modification GTPase
MDDGLSEEWVLEDLRAAITALGAIGGELSNEELYDRIFSTFCIGK